MPWFNPATRFEHGVVVPFRSEARMETVSGRNGKIGGQCSTGINGFNPLDAAVKVISEKKGENLGEKWQSLPAS
jgi:hypothetical protein